MSIQVLTITNFPKGAEYARLSALNASPDITVDSLWLNRPISIEIGERVLVEQAGKRIDFNGYDLVIWWPSSFQDPRERLGASYYLETGEEYVSRAWQVLEEGLLSGVLSLLNSYESSRRAANKLVSTLVARQLAIPVPRTVFGNWGARVASWNERVVVKTITDTVDSVGGKLLTTEVSAETLIQAEPAPFIYQERINLEREVRAYYFNGVSETIALRQNANSEPLSDISMCSSEEITVEIVKQGHDHEIITNYNALLARALKLRMFCADYLISRSGTAYLIDVNPHGTWHWLAEPIRASLDNKFVEMISRIAVHG